jgi:hypothetical protein
MPRLASNGALTTGDTTGGYGAEGALVRSSRPDQAIMDWVHNDPELASACAAAVDPLEIAARLETYGLSSRVAGDVFGYPDVFAAAQAVYDGMPFVDTEAPPKPSQPMGSPFDLLRGALYAIPALFFTVLVNGFGVPMKWWVLPVGLTVAWGISQAAATAGWALRGRGSDRSDALVSLSSILVSAAATLGVAVLARAEFGGTRACVVVAVVLAAYLAASGVLLFQQAEWLLALCLLPAAVGSVLSLQVLPYNITQRNAAWTVVASAALVLLVALRHVPSSRWHRTRLGRGDWVRATKFMFYGFGCGLLTSVIIGFGQEARVGDAMAIAVWPLLLTLGLMEWHLRSFRSRATTALSASSDLDNFAHRVRIAFLRSVGTYIAGLAVLSAVAVEVGRDRHAAMVPLFLGAIGALGIAFFLALMLASSDQINLVLVCWAATFVVLGACLVAVRVHYGHIAPLAGITSLLIACSVAIVILAAMSRRLLTSPLSY